ncbi:MAG: CopG family transcriptional regulator [Actinomycetota bacterium]
MNLEGLDMTSRKTAVSIDEELFSKADNLAAEMGMSRSQLYAVALEAFLKQQENELLLAQINEAYSTPSTPEEEEMQAMISEHMIRMTEDEW